MASRDAPQGSLERLRLVTGTRLVHVWRFKDWKGFSWLAGSRRGELKEGGGRSKGKKE